MALTDTHKKEIMRMQRELQVLDNALGQLSTERRLNESERNKGNATLENLKPFADDSVTYKSVGRMFLRQPLPALRQELQGYTDECAKDVKSLSEKEQQLLKQLNSTRSNLGDYIKSNGLQNFVRFQ